MKTNVTSAPTFSIFRCSNDVDFCFILSATSLFANKLPCLWWLYFIFSTRSSCRAQEATTCLWVIVVWEHLPGNLFDILLPFVLRGTYFKMHILQRHLVLWPKQNASNKDRRTTKTNLVSQQIYWINTGVCWRHLLSTFLYYLNDQILTVWMNNQAPKLLCHGWVIGIPERVTWFHLWHAELAEFSFNLGSWSFEQHCVQTNIGDKTIHPFGKPMDSSGASYMQSAGVCFRQHILWEVYSKTISEFGASAIWAASSSIDIGPNCSKFSLLCEYQQECRGCPAEVSKCIASASRDIFDSWGTSKMFKFFGGDWSCSRGELRGQCYGASCTCVIIIVEEETGFFVVKKVEIIAGFF